MRQGAFLFFVLPACFGATTPPESPNAAVPQTDQTSQSSTPANPDAAASRAEQWKKLRREKLKKIEPQRQTGLERGLLWVEKGGLEKILNFNVGGFQPKFGGLPTGSGFGFGTRYRHNFKNSPIDLQSSATWSYKGYQQYGIQLGKIQPRRPGAFFYADLGYRNFPQEDFFGLGPGSRKEHRTDFRFEEASYDGVVGYRVRPWLHTDFRAGYVQVNTDPGKDKRFLDTQRAFDDVSAPGLAVQPGFFRVAYSAIADYRDVPGNPHNGGMIGLALSRYDSRGRNLYSFNRLAFDVRHYLSLLSKARVLAARFYTSHDDPDATSRVPFYYQQTLGGGDSLRGFREYRFRDTRLLYLSGEYRWEAVTAVEFVLFYDAGKVFSQREDFNFKGLKKSWGAGIRFKTPESMILRIDVGRSREGTRLYIKFGPSF